MDTEKPKIKKIELAWSDELPICPYCEKEIEQICSRGVKRSIAVCYCPYCRKVLGTATFM